MTHWDGTESCPNCGRRTGWDGHPYGPCSRDAWSNDPDRTTRNGDTRTPERVTADVILSRVTRAMPCTWCPERGWHDPEHH